MSLAALLTGLLLAVAPASLPDIEDEVMCVVCGTVLNVSGSKSADQQRDFIRKRVAEGMSKQEIKDALVEEYGPAVLAVPEAKGTDLAVYLVPGLVVLLALGGIVVFVRSGGRSSPGGGGSDGGGPGIDPADASRLDAELAAFDR